MKHFFLSMLLSVFISISYAQTEHMKFKGVPMEGTIQSFTNKLVAKGFTSIGIEDGVSLLTGELAKNCG